MPQNNRLVPVHFDALGDAGADFVFHVADAYGIAGQQRMQVQMVGFVADLAVIRNQDADAVAIAAAGAQVESALADIHTVDPAFDVMQLMTKMAFLDGGDHDGAIPW